MCGSLTQFSFRKYQTKNSLAVGFQQCLALQRMACYYYELLHQRLPVFPFARLSNHSLIRKCSWTHSGSSPGGCDCRLQRRKANTPAQRSQSPSWLASGLRSEGVNPTPSVAEDGKTLDRINSFPFCPARHDAPRFSLQFCIDRTDF